MPEERPRQKKQGGVGQTIGGILVGFDEQVWRRQPPAQERVAEVHRLGTVVTPSGLSIDMPEAAQPHGTPDRRPDPPDSSEASAR